MISSIRKWDCQGQWRLTPWPAPVVHFRHHLFLLAMFVPGSIDEIRTGVFGGVIIDPISMLLTSLLWIIPLIMMSLSLFLRRSVLRWLTIIFGLTLGLICFFDLISTFFISFETIKINSVIIQALAVTFQFIIVWHGWKWPTEAE